MSLPRGIRNKNPGNIEHGDQWEGLASVQEDDRFCTFSDPVYGVRAMCKIFFSYKRRGVETISQIVSTWAPPIENPTAAYIQHVAEWSGIGPDEVPDLTSAEDLASLAMAMARQENGMYGFDKSVYLAGAELALKG